MWLIDAFLVCWQEISSWFFAFIGLARAHWVIILIISISSFVLTIVGCALMITNLPSNYFLHAYRERRIKNHFLRFFVSLLKNIVGFIIVVFGALMSLPGVPGQGLLTILVGLIISDFPGKKRLVNRIIRIRAVYMAANKIRLLFKRPPLELEEMKGQNQKL